MWLRMVRPSGSLLCETSIWINHFFNCCNCPLCFLWFVLVLFVLLVMLVLLLAVVVVIDDVEDKSCWQEKRLKWHLCKCLARVMMDKILERYMNSESSCCCGCCCGCGCDDCDDCDDDCWGVVVVGQKAKRMDRVIQRQLMLLLSVLVMHVGDVLLLLLLLLLLVKVPWTVLDRFFRSIHESINDCLISLFNQEKDQREQSSEHINKTWSYTVISSV